MTFKIRAKVFYSLPDYTTGYFTHLSLNYLKSKRPKITTTTTTSDANYSILLLFARLINIKIFKSILAFILRIFEGGATHTHTSGSTHTYMHIYSTHILTLPPTHCSYGLARKVFRQKL